MLGTFTEQFKVGKPLTVVGDGLQRRDFTYVGDIVSGLIKASDVLRNEEYQLGSGKDYSILEVAQMFGREITFIPQRRGDRRYGRADTEKTSEMLGWEAKTSLTSWIDNIKNENTV